MKIDRAHGGVRQILILKYGQYFQNQQKHSIDEITNSRIVENINLYLFNLPTQRVSLIGRRAERRQLIIICFEPRVPFGASLCELAVAAVLILILAK
jgi:hypothetical protein